MNAVKTILFVENDPVALTMYQNRLQREGFHVETAPDGLVALKFLSQFTPDVVVLDLMLPRFSGSEVFKFMRRDSRLKNVPVVIFSNAAMTDWPQDLGVGTTQCLPKTESTFPQLLQTIRDMILMVPVATPAPQPQATPAPGPPPLFAPAPVAKPSVSASTGVIPPPSSPSSTATIVTKSRPEFVKDALAEIPKLHELCLAYIKAPASEASRQHLNTLHWRVHTLSTEASQIGCTRVAMLTSAFGALLSEIMTKPSWATPSILQTMAQAVDCLRFLLKSDDVNIAEPSPKARVLAVDDDPVCNHVMLTTLRRANFDITNIENPVVALKLLENNRYDLVLLDVNMPDLSGFEVCMKLRQLPHCRTIPIIFVTAFNNFENRKQSVLSGGDDFITKPISPLELALKVTIHMLKAQVKRGAAPEAAREAMAPAAPQPATQNGILELRNPAPGLFVPTTESRTSDVPLNPFQPAPPDRFPSFNPEAPLQPAVPVHPDPLEQREELVPASLAPASESLTSDAPTEEAFQTAPLAPEEAYPAYVGEMPLQPAVPAHANPYAPCEESSLTPSNLFAPSTAPQSNEAPAFIPFRPSPPPAEQYPGQGSGPPPIPPGFGQNDRPEEQSFASSDLFAPPTQPAESSAGNAPAIPFQPAPPPPEQYPAESAENSPQQAPPVYFSPREDSKQDMSSPPASSLFAPPTWQHTSESPEASPFEPAAPENRAAHAPEVPAHNVPPAYFHQPERHEQTPEPPAPFVPPPEPLVRDTGAANPMQAFPAQAPEVPPQAVPPATFSEPERQAEMSTPSSFFVPPQEWRASQSPAVSSYQPAPPSGPAPIRAPDAPQAPPGYFARPQRDEEKPAPFSAFEPATRPQISEPPAASSFKPQPPAEHEATRSFETPPASPVPSSRAEHEERKSSSPFSSFAPQTEERGSETPNISAMHPAPKAEHFPAHAPEVPSHAVPASPNRPEQHEEAPRSFVPSPEPHTGKTPAASSAQPMTPPPELPPVRALETPRAASQPETHEEQPQPSNSFAPVPSAKSHPGEAPIFGSFKPEPAAAEQSPAGSAEAPSAAPVAFSRAEPQEPLSEPPASFIAPPDEPQAGEAPIVLSPQPAAITEISPAPVAEVAPETSSPAVCQESPNIFTTGSQSEPSVQSTSSRLVEAADQSTKVSEEAASTGQTPIPPAASQPAALSDSTPADSSQAPAEEIKPIASIPMPPMESHGGEATSASTPAEAEVSQAEPAAEATLSRSEEPGQSVQPIPQPESAESKIESASDIPASRAAEASLPPAAAPATASEASASEPQLEQNLTSLSGDSVETASSEIPSDAAPTSLGTPASQDGPANQGETISLGEAASQETVSQGEAAIQSIPSASVNTENAVADSTAVEPEAGQPEQKEENRSASSTITAPAPTAGTPEANLRKAAPADHTPSSNLGDLRQSALQAAPLDKTDSSSEPARSSSEAPAKDQVDSGPTAGSASWKTETTDGLTTPVLLQPAQVAVPPGKAAVVPSAATPGSPQPESPAAKPGSAPTSSNPAFDNIALQIARILFAGEELTEIKIRLVRIAMERYTVQQILDGSAGR